MATNNLYFDPCDGYYSGETGPRNTLFAGTFTSSGGYQNRAYIGGAKISRPLPTPDVQAVAGCRVYIGSVGFTALFFGGPNGFDLTDLIVNAGFTNLGIPVIMLPNPVGSIYGSDGFTIFPGVYYYLVLVTTIAYDSGANHTTITAAFFVDGIQRVSTSQVISGKVQNGKVYGCQVTNFPGRTQDVYMSGEASLATTPWFDLVVVSFAPTGDGALLQWTPTPGGTHFSTIDNVPADDTTFITDTGVNTQDDHTYSPSLPTNTGIVGAQLTSLHEQTDAGVAQMQHEYRVSGVNYDGNLFTLPESYVYGDSAWFQNPATAAAWVAADLAGPNEWGEQRTF